MQASTADLVRSSADLPLIGLPWIIARELGKIQGKAGKGKDADLQLKGTDFIPLVASYRSGRAHGAAENSVKPTGDKDASSSDVAIQEISLAVEQISVKLVVT